MKRFSRSFPCPICGGHNGLPQHAGIRCHGYLSSDQKFLHCSRVPCGPQERGSTWAHRIGSCRCGQEHQLSDVAAVEATTTPERPKRDFLALWEGLRRGR
jgi:hypothetical protein